MKPDSPEVEFVPRPSFLSRPALVCGTSILAMAGLSFALWAPWERLGKDASPTLQFYCAAAMAHPIRELLADFEKETGIKVAVNFGSSGSLLASIRTTKGKGDLYLAADAKHIAQGKAFGLIREEIRLGTLKPALAVNRNTQKRLLEQGKPIRSLKDCLREDLKMFLADPTKASIGIMSQEIFRNQGLLENIEAERARAGGRVSTTTTVQEVVTAIKTTDQSCGIIWVALAKGNPDLVMVPLKELEGYAEPMLLGVLSGSENPAAALKLARFLQARDRGGEVFTRHHYDPFDRADAWDPRPVIHLDAGAMLRPALDPVIRRFEEREGVKIHTNYAGCGVLVSKMKGQKKAGPGFDRDRFPDAFFSCEISFLEQVGDWFEAGTLISENEIVLAVARGKEKEIRELADLVQDHLRIGLCDPEKSALGKLTDNILVNLDLRERIVNPDRKFPVDFLPEAHLFIPKIKLRAMDAAVVYRSNVESNPENLKDIVIVRPETPNAIARQPFAIAQDTPHRQLLLRFQKMLLTEASREDFQSRGFRWAAKKGK